MIKGHIKWFDAAKGFGFIVCDDDEGDILLHANVLRNFGRSSVSEGSEITFEIQVTDRGRQASEILEIGPPVDRAIDGDENAQDIPEVDPSVPLEPARVKWFDKAKGFGFANVFGSDQDIFLHIEILRHYGLSDFQPGEAISIKVIDGPRGKMAGEIHTWDHANK